jgi:UDP-N-acetylmuramoyl-tripeptide--D-alanyl-D-alanine ligase
MKKTFNGIELAECTGGEWNLDLSSDSEFSNVFTDTRVDCSGGIFLALRGENFDAHDFLEAAVDSGASALCIEKTFVSRINPLWDIPVLTVEDTLSAYQAIANFHRKRFDNLSTVAITGSMGKTSCKEILRSILVAAVGEDAVYATKSNTNNQVGVPQNLLNVNSKHRFCVLEMGTNHFGEIEPLSRTLEPDVALLNSIAPCHLEAFGDLRGVAEEKCKIFSALKPEGTAVVPAECPEIAYILKQTEEFKTLCFGKDVGFVYHGGNFKGSTIELFFEDLQCGIKVDWSLSGAHQASNAAAAATVARALGIGPQSIAEGLRNCILPGMRMKTFTKNGVEWINDAYNASPQSVQAVLSWVKEFAEPDKLVIVLGDMLELGKSSLSQHKKVMDFAVELFPDANFIFIGNEYCKAGQGTETAENCFFRNSSVEAKELLQTLLEPGKIVLLKGSRGMKLEKVLPDENS